MPTVFLPEKFRRDVFAPGPELPAPRAGRELQQGVPHELHLRSPEGEGGRGSHHGTDERRRVSDGNEGRRQTHRGRKGPRETGWLVRRWGGGGGIGWTSLPCVVRLFF